jgi:hypothetical protein
MRLTFFHRPTSSRHATIARVRATSIALFAFTLLAAACGGEASSSAKSRDSSGVRIVESSAADSGAGEQWAVANTPRLSIGLEDGDERYQFSRIGGVARLDDGRIAVGDGGSSQLRLYDSAGAFIAARGRLGQGPEEFGQFSSLRIWRAPNGELLVNDSGNDRVNVFDRTGAYVRSVKLAAAPNGPRVFLVDVFADGTLLASAPDGGGRLDASVVGPLAPMQFAYLRYSPAGAYLGRVLGAADRPRYVNEYGQSRHFPYIPLTPEPKFVARDTTVLAYRGPRAEIEQWSAGGKQVAAIRWSAGAPRAVADVWDRYVTESLDRMEGEQRLQYQHFYRQPLSLPSVVPAVDALLVDGDGNVWARRYRLPWETAQRWDVLSPEGTWVAAIETPDRLTVAQIGRDFVLGTHRDSLGVERVQLFGLTRGALP